jgi:peptidoglycan-associated lipoprotein
MRRLFSFLALLSLTTVPAFAQVWPSSSPAAKDFRANMKDVLFDYNKHEVPGSDTDLQTNAAYLKAHPDVKVRIEGYTDPRGTITYNLVLSQQRADAAKADLIKAGVSPDRIVSSVGWGKLYQTCEQEQEGCWKDNRRAHFRYFW